MTGTVREYLYAGGEAPTAMRARQADGTYQNYFFVTNTHGDVVAVTDKDGVIVNRYAYGPWGEATRVSEQVHQPFRYAGYRYEDGFDLYYLRARWYDAGTGRFLSRDPLGPSMHDLGQMNLYIYAASAPATNVDPDGYSPRSTDVVTFLHGVNSTEETARGWLTFLAREFPASDTLVYHYTLFPHMVGFDGALVRELSARYKAEVGGRRLYAIGHSWGGVLAFKISARASLNVPLVITMGSPLYRKGFGANRNIAYWVAICSDSDEICDSQHLEQTRRNDPIYGADEVVIPGGIGHGGYLDSSLIKKFIVAKMRQHGAR